MRAALIRAAGLGGLCAALAALGGMPGYAHAALAAGHARPALAARTDDLGQAHDIDLLLSSARLWRARHRNDLARDALHKALLAQPNQPEALAMLGQIEIEENHTADAMRYLRRLKTLYPASPATQALSDAVRVHTSERQRLAKARLLSRSGQAEEAFALYRQIFPSGAPPGELGIEYYRAQADTPQGWAIASAGLKRMARAVPDDPQPLQALAALLVERPADRLGGVRLAAELAARPDVDRPAILAIWQRGLSKADGNPAWLPLYRRYLALAPNDRDIRKQYEQFAMQEEARRRLAADPAYQAEQRGIAQLDQGHLAKAEAALLQASAARPDDPQLLGALGLLRMRQGRHHEAYDYFAQANRRDPADANKWRSLMRTASFWGALADAKRARDAGALGEADRYARSALAIDPSSADALAARAEIASADHRDGDAERLYRRALQSDPQNGSALRGLIALLARHHRRQEVSALLGEWRARYPKSGPRLDRAEAAYLANQADEQIAQAHNGPALAMLERAVTLDPAAPWTRYTLASLYRRLGLPEIGRQVMEEGVRQPGSAGSQAQMRYAQAIYLNVLDDTAGAVRTLDRIPSAERTPSMRQLRTTLQIRQMAQAARQARAAGDAPGSARRFDAAIALAGDDPELRADVASELIAAGEPDRGLGLMRAWLRSHENPPQPAARLRYAELLAQAQRDDALRAWLAGIDPVGLDATQREAWQGLQDRLALRSADRLRAAGQFAAAHAALQPLLSRTPPERRAQAALADLYVDERRYGDARALCEQLLQQDPQDQDVRLSLVRTLYEMQQDEAASQALARVLAETPADDVSTRLGAARRLSAMQRLDQAQALTEDLRKRFPNDPSVTVQLGRIAQAGGHYGEAMNWYRQARQQEVAAGTLPDQDGQTSAQAAEASVEARRQGHLAAADEIATKKGDGGVSQFNTRVLSLYGQFAAGYDGHVFAQTDNVWADAGDLALNGSTQFGVLPLLDAATFQQRFPGAGTDFGSARQTAHGQALAVGYSNDWLRADIGSTPIGFPVSYLTGGVRLYGSRARLDYWVDVSRRALSGSLLSYAGSHLPLPAVFGGDVVWGGVRRDAATFHAARDFPRFGLFGEASVARLTGKNVLSNSELSARGGVDLPLLYRQDLRLNTGVTLFFDSYAQNERFYTYGHGGYYSPQSYLSLTVPLEWMGRAGRLSYYLRGAVSVSRSYEKAMPYFPTSDTLQALGGNPTYSSGGGWGFGFSLSASAEYRIDRRWVVGGRAQAERSEYYAPNRFLLYVRYYLDPQGERVPFPPSPLRPVSSY